MEESITPTDDRYHFGMDEKQWVAFTSVIAAIFLTVTKLIVGFWTNSLGILSEALHSALDLFAAGITLYAVRKAAEPPDSDHHYGHGRIENLSALVQTILLLITVIWIMYEATRRIIFNELTIEANLFAFGVIIFAIIIDYSRSRALKRVAKKYDSQALEADALHFSTDILSSSVVFVGLLFAYFGFPLGDPLAAIGVAIIVLYLTIKLGRETIDVLLDRAPKGLVGPIRRAVEGLEGIKECGRVRLRKAGPVTFVDLICYAEHTLPLEKAHEMSMKARKTVEQILGRADVVVHMDLASRKHQPLTTEIYESASQFSWILHVDRVDVFETNGQFIVSLELDIEADKPLAEAHQLVSEFEAHLQKQNPKIKEIVTHIEPGRKPPIHQLNLVTIHSQLRWLVKQHPTLHNCHAVRLQPLGPNLYNLMLKCEAEPELSVEETHKATTLLEDEIREQFPLFSQITIHVEPLKGKSKTKE
jgi:cation diffusion facilitator family transporter